MPGITWLASYPKSGNTWTRVLLANYLRDEELTSLDDLNLAVPDLTANLLNRGRLLPLGEDRPLAVKTHFMPDVEVMQQYREHTGKVIYLVRSPRDVMLSSARHLNIAEGHKADFVKYFIANRGVPQWEESGWGTWPRHVDAWTLPDPLHENFPHADVLVVRYEDLRADPFAELGRMAEFLNLAGGTDPERIRRAVENSTLEKMRAGEMAERTRGVSAFRNPPKNDFIGDGQRRSSLAAIGDEVEEAYLRLLKEDEEFFRCAERFGYSQ